MDPKEVVLIVSATLANASLAASLVLLSGADSAATELALRTTARVSFVWFMLAFVASPLNQLRPSRISAWLLKRRRALGVIFGLSMSIHVGFILRLFALHAPARPPMVTDADFLIGIPGLMMVAVLTITSVEALKRRLGALVWQRLHTTGIWVVWMIFFLCLVDSVGRKTTAHPVLAYYAFIAVLLLGMALRVVAARARRTAATVLLLFALVPSLAGARDIDPKANLCRAINTLPQGEELVLAPGEYQGPCAIRRGWGESLSRARRRRSAAVSGRG